MQLDAQPCAHTQWKHTGSNLNWLSIVQNQTLLNGYIIELNSAQWTIRRGSADMANSTEQL
jgi:hypothetical protein